MSASTWTVVLRAVLPTTDIDAVLPLYIDGDAAAATLHGRHSIAVTDGMVSLGSYFNAFPAATWQAETDADVVRLRVHAAGRGSLVIQRSDADARATEVARREIDSDSVVALDLPLHGFDRGGAYWFDLVAHDGELRLLDADWSIDRPIRETATVAITTFNRPHECLAQLRALALDQGVRDVIDRIVLVDQGSDTVQSQAEFPEVAEVLGDRLSVIRQPNMGGSGGFARGMFESLQAAQSDGVLLLDDDAIIEPEAIVRAVRFAGAARAPLIVGGGMLHLDDRSRLYAQSEQWDRRIGWFRLHRPGAYDHDFAATPFRQAPFFHRTHRSDFNGWWMCLIPVSVLRAGGLALPLFLKGDDVEFGLRAGARGVRTVSPTGIALWHLGWGGKAPTRTWESYFLHRNRLITELLHARESRPTADDPALVPRRHEAVAHAPVLRGAPARPSGRGCSFRTGPAAGVAHSSVGPDPRTVAELPRRDERHRHDGAGRDAAPRPGAIRDRRDPRWAIPSSHARPRPWLRRRTAEDPRHGGCAGLVHLRSRRLGTRG